MSELARHPTRGVNLPKSQPLPTHLCTTCLRRHQVLPVRHSCWGQRVKSLRSAQFKSCARISTDLVAAEYMLNIQGYAPHELDVENYADARELCLSYR